MEEKDTTEEWIVKWHVWEIDPDVETENSVNEDEYIRKWNEYEDLTAEEVLQQVRRNLRVPEGESIIDFTSNMDYPHVTHHSAAVEAEEEYMSMKEDMKQDEPLLQLEGDCKIEVSGCEPLQLEGDWKIEVSGCEPLYHPVLIEDLVKEVQKLTYDQSMKGLIDG